MCVIIKTMKCRRQQERVNHLYVNVYQTVQLGLVHQDAEDSKRELTICT